MAETAAQLETRLANVRAAIDRAINAASYSIASRQHTNQTLKNLRDLEKDLERKLARLINGPIVLTDFSQLDSDKISGRF